jgi:hypothetical protein
VREAPAAARLHWPGIVRRWIGLHNY